MFHELKSDILGRLDFLPNIVDYRTTKPEVVMLNAIHTDTASNCRYQLSILVQVEKTFEAAAIVVDSFQVIEVHFFVNKGQTPPFTFSITELNDYIDYL